MAKADCEIYNSATMTLEEVLEVMYRMEAAGKMTVRLHTGDAQSVWRHPRTDGRAR